jgi:hypothetical protein
MTSTGLPHTNQRLPNRRFRRLLPAALAGATIAAGVPFAAPPPVRAADVPHRAEVRVAPHRKAVKPRMPARAERAAAQDAGQT